MLSFPRDVLDEIWDLIDQFLRVFLPTPIIISEYKFKVKIRMGAFSLSILIMILITKLNILVKAPHTVS